MIHKFLIAFLLLYSCQLFSQELQVLITEKKKGKRVVLYAENRTQDTLNVFLLVNADGYRKSASKPVLKNIAPKTKVPMITLIELSESPMYTYDLIVNEEEFDLNFTYEKQATDIEKIIEGRLVIFSMPNCDKCNLLAATLENKRTPHKVFDITENAVIYSQFMAFIERSLTVETKIQFPVIWNKDHTIFGYDDLELLLNELD